MDESRWQEAQAAEASYWQGTAASAWRLLNELAEHYGPLAGQLPSLLAGRSGLQGIEIGIGPLGIGFLGVYAAGHFSRIVGVEPLAIQEIQQDDKDLQAYARALQARVEVVACKGESLPFDDASFDVACCINVLDHTQDPLSILAQARRVLKSEGLLLLGVHTRSNLGIAKWQAMRRLHRGDWFYKAHPYAWTWRGLDTILRREWQCLWHNRPTPKEQLLGHQRMSMWALRPIPPGSGL